MLIFLSLNIGSDRSSQARCTATPFNYDFPRIEDNMLNKLLGIFPPLANREQKIGHARGLHLSLQRFSK